RRKRAARLRGARVLAGRERAGVASYESGFPSRLGPFALRGGHASRSLPPSRRGHPPVGVDGRCARGGLRVRGRPASGTLPARLPRPPHGSGARGFTVRASRAGCVPWSKVEVIVRGRGPRFERGRFGARVSLARLLRLPPYTLARRVRWGAAGGASVRMLR